MTIEEREEEILFCKTNKHNQRALGKARGYAYAKTEYVSVRTYLAKIEYAYDTFRSVR